MTYTGVRIFIINDNLFLYRSIKSWENSNIYAFYFLEYTFGSSQIVTRINLKYADFFEYIRKLV